MNFVEPRWIGPDNGGTGVPRTRDARIHVELPGDLIDRQVEGCGVA